MFAAVYFKGDRKFETLNYRKLKKLDGTVGVLNFEIGEKVYVSYKTNSIDDAGRERIIDEDYEGVITFLHKDKSEVAKFAEKEDDIVRAWSSGSLKAYVDQFMQQDGEVSKRKKKKTEKMMSFMDDKQAESQVKDKSEESHTCSSPSKSGKVKTSSKRKHQLPAADQDSPSKSTRSKLSVQKITQEAAKETQKLQTMEYFKKKKIMSDQRVNNHLQVNRQIANQPDQTEQLNINQPTQQQVNRQIANQPDQTEQLNINQPTQQQVNRQIANQPDQTAQLNINQQTTPQQVLNQPAQAVHQLQQQLQNHQHQVNNQTHHHQLQYQQQHPFSQQQQFFQQFIPNQLPFHQQKNLNRQHLCSQQQLNQKQHHIMNQEQQQPTYIDMDAGKSLISTGVISQGLRALNSFECTSCESNRSLISNLRSENEQLKKEIMHLKGGVASDIINDIRAVIVKYEGKERNCEKSQVYNEDNYEEAMDQSLLSSDWSSSFTTTMLSSFTVDNNESSASASSSRTSTPIPKSKNRSISSNNDVIETVENHESFFKPDKNKIKLVDGHCLYVDSSQFQAMKNRSKKNPSRLVRELLSYFFTAEYLGRHSATGNKSTKKGLPAEIMDPIRVFMSTNYKFEETNIVTNRKCLDVTRKTERPPKQLNISQDLY